MARERTTTSRRCSDGQRKGPNCLQKNQSLFPSNKFFSDQPRVFAPKMGMKSQKYVVTTIDSYPINQIKYVRSKEEWWGAPSRTHWVSRHTRDRLKELGPVTGITAKTVCQRVLGMSGIGNCWMLNVHSKKAITEYFLREKYNEEVNKNLSISSNHIGSKWSDTGGHNAAVPFSSRRVWKEGLPMR